MSNQGAAGLGLPGMAWSPQQLYLSIFLFVLVFFNFFSPIKVLCEGHHIGPLSQVHALSLLQDQALYLWVPPATPHCCWGPVLC